MNAIVSVCSFINETMFVKYRCEATHSLYAALLKYSYCISLNNIAIMPERQRLPLLFELASSMGYLTLIASLFIFLAFHLTQLLH